MDWLKNLPPKKPVKSDIRLRTQADQLAKVSKLEDALLKDSLDVVGGVLRFHEIDPTEEMPEEFEAEHGDDAKKMWRLAIAGNKSAKEAPVGVKVATQVSMGIVRARATEKSAPRSLHIEKVQMVVTGKQYPMQEVEE